MTEQDLKPLVPSASAADIAVVTQVVLTERQGRDRGWWEQMRAAYWPDSHVRLSWYGGFGDGDGDGFVAGAPANGGSCRSTRSTSTPR